MILNIRILIFSILIIVGYYFFYNEYIKLNSFETLEKQDYQLFEDVNVNIENFETTKQKDDKKSINNTKETDVSYEKIEIIVSKGETFLSILKEFNISEKRSFEIISEIEKLFNLRKLKVEEKILFYLDTNNSIKIIEFYKNINEKLIVSINSNNIKIENKILEKTSYQTSKEFNINNSLYSDGLKNNLPQDILIKLIRLFSFDLDFQRDIKKNTLVSVLYEYDQIKDNNKFEYKDIFYALININGNKLEYFRFLTDDGFVDYFNKDGKNVKKSILKTPLDGARLSSNFGMRKHPISGYNKMHKGVDFAAPTGTPIYAGGNGVIEFIGNNGGYGKYIRIRHNNEYKTAYGHMSGFKKGLSKGLRVNQGEIIGYVGSTGKSTGPHLHYEIIFQNEQINPLKLKLPSGKVLKGKELSKFQREAKKIYANHLNQLYE
ncbi:M23 family metallopeptidase [Pelagibacteraceae bacterium]|nr:M23 family metallopeptidase [Pelagibacteraceae bacterium]